MNGKNEIDISAKREQVYGIFDALGLPRPHVFCYDLTDSTNTRAKLFAESGESSGKAPAIFFSRAQSAGRGTRSRIFESPEGGGAYVSFLFYPEGQVGGAGLTAYAAVAAARAVDSLSEGRLNTKIKWVNDLVINDRKLGGILSECKLSDGGYEYAIVGIGINTKEGEHSDEVSGIMTCLASHGVYTEPWDVALALTKEFFSRLFEADGRATLDEYRRRSSVIGRRVTLYRPDGVKDVTVTGIEDDGSITVLEDGENIKSYNSGDVTVRPATETKED